jgi:hypothetical protein
MVSYRIWFAGDILMVHLHFLFFNDPFFWVRASTLSSLPDRVEVRKLYETNNFAPTAIPVFNRFGTSRLFRTYHSLCMRLNIPYIVDIDDLFWQLPSFSQDTFTQGSQLSFLRELVKGATMVTTTCDELRREIVTEFGHQKVLIVPNTPPTWFAPPQSALIANTDTFKMNSDGIRWFGDVLTHLLEEGIPIQLIGANGALIEARPELLLYSLPQMSYPDYLKTLMSHSFWLGLIPVDASPYADCKSAIKAQEFLSAGMRVVASEIAPHLHFKNQYNHPDFIIVENTYESWRDAIDQFLRKRREEEVLRGKATVSLLQEARHVQREGWKEVLAEIAPLAPTPSQIEHLMQGIRRYEFARDKVRKIKHVASRILPFSMNS